MFYSWDLPLPVILDFEIWKASNMLFQKVPYYKEEEDANGENDESWDDTWHKKFESLDSPSVDTIKNGKPQYLSSNRDKNKNTSLNMDNNDNITEDEDKVVLRKSFLNKLPYQMEKKTNETIFKYESNSKQARNTTICEPFQVRPTLTTTSIGYIPHLKSENMGTPFQQNDLGYNKQKMNGTNILDTPEMQSNLSGSDIKRNPRETKSASFKIDKNDNHMKKLNQLSRQNIM